jgi:hypothetical protein
VTAAVCRSAAAECHGQTSRNALQSCPKTWKEHTQKLEEEIEKEEDDEENQDGIGKSPPTAELDEANNIPPANDAR